MTRSFVKHRFFLLFVVLCLPVLLHAQEPVPLEPGKPLEREIAGGQTHTYQITLTAGQFMHVVVEQKGIRVIVALVAPNGKQIAEAYPPRGEYGFASLSYEAAVSGDHQVIEIGRAHV